MRHILQSTYSRLFCETWLSSIWHDESAILLRIVPLVEDVIHVGTNKLYDLLQTVNIRWVRLREQVHVATVQVAVRNIFKNTTFEWPKSSCISV
jgi:hypothetical protein